MYEWRTGRDCIFKNDIHLVFVTKSLGEIFSNEMLRRVEDIMNETCSQMDCDLLSFSGGDNHIHMTVSAHPKIAVSNLVSKLKAKSSYFLRREYPSELESHLWGRHFWSPSYCLLSCQPDSLGMVEKYIERQSLRPNTKAAKTSQALRKIEKNWA